MSFDDCSYPSSEELTIMREDRRLIRSRDGSDTTHHRKAKESPSHSSVRSWQHHRPHTSFHLTTPSYRRSPPVYFRNPHGSCGNHRSLNATPLTSYVRPPASHMSRSDYVTPSIYELLRILQAKAGYANQEDQIWSNLYLGDEHAATDKDNLERLGITHILNAADGINNVNTGSYFYRDMPIAYYGVEALDDSRFHIYPFFYPAAKFINHGLNTPSGKVLVHCAMGISRAPTIVLAYLMIYRDMTLVEAIETVLAKRPIYPNRGFLAQLRQLDIKLAQERAGDSSPEP
ncbi:dual specificity phosphatase 29-like isoform X2 [Ambystoma mexicanum]